MEFATKALELDDTLPDAHATMGLILSLQEPENSEEEFRTAISLNPSYASAHHWYSWLLLGTGRLKEGLDEIIKAAELDPLSNVINLNLARAFEDAGRRDDMMSVLNKLVQIEPGFPLAYLFRCYGQAIRGLRNESLADVEMFYKLTRNECGHKVLRAECEALLGNKEEALRLIEDAIPLVETSHEPFSSAWVYATIGDRNSFFEWINWSIERKIVKPFEFATDLRYIDIFKAVREDPRIVEVFRKLNLPREHPLLEFLATNTD
jgi:tetratricopeptide (TPR) repeat protein